MIENADFANCLSNLQFDGSRSIAGHAFYLYTCYYGRVYCFLENRSVLIVMNYRSLMIPAVRT